MMEIKKNKCPNCGATLHYNKRMNRYECHYCSAVYDDTNKNDVDNRVELSPDELEKMKPINNPNRSQQNKSNASVTAIILILVVFFGIPLFIEVISIIFSIIFTFAMM